MESTRYFDDNSIFKKGWPSAFIHFCFQCPFKLYFPYGKMKSLRSFSVLSAGNRPIRQAYGWGLRAFSNRGSKYRLPSCVQEHLPLWFPITTPPSTTRKPELVPALFQAGVSWQEQATEMQSCTWRLSFRLLNLKVLGILWERWDSPAWKITAETQPQAAGWTRRDLDDKQSLQVDQEAFILRHALSPRAEQCRSHSPRGQARKDPLALAVHFYTAPAKTVVW